MPTLHETVMCDPDKLGAEIFNDLMASQAEIAAAIRAAIRHERAQCARIAAEYGGRDAQEIADLIGARNFAK